jgi:hypothetical protein
MSDFDVLAVCMCLLFVAVMVLINSTHDFQRRLVDLEQHAGFMDRRAEKEE